MKVSYNILKSYLPKLESPQIVAELLTMHTAEVEEIHETGKHLEKVFIATIKSVTKHPDSEKLNLCSVELNDETFQIVCGAPNVHEGAKVPLAIVGADLGGGFIIAKTKIRGESSSGMICSEDELGLKEERQEGIFILPDNAPLGMSMKEYLGTHDSIIEVDNKAINHRPDLFSHVGIARELATLTGEEFTFQYIEDNFSDSPENQKIDVQVPNLVRRYIGVKMENVENIKSPSYIDEILKTEGVEAKGLLVDITNYSLYLYGQPTHCFDADTLEGNIVVRMAKAGESFHALNDKEYELTEHDIVIADQKKVIALGGIIGGKHTAVSGVTKNVIIEAAHFDQATVRQTGKRHGLRTDALNVFEKDLQPDMAEKGASLIVSEITKRIDGAKVTGYSDVYSKKQEVISVDFDLAFVNNLIGREYSEEKSLKILSDLGIQNNNGKLLVPFWRKDIKFKADIAEEITRIDGYDNVEATNIRINTGAVLQNTSYRIKRDSRNFWTQKGFYDMYNYSFVGEELMQKLGESSESLIPLKNYLSEDATHMKNNHIPNLLKTLEQNIKQFKSLNIFEIERVYKKSNTKISESTMITGLMTSKDEVPYYEIQKLVSEYLENIGVNKYFYEKCTQELSYIHTGRTSQLLIRGQVVGTVGEIHPIILKNFKLTDRVAFFDINLDSLETAAYSIVKAKEISEFQENTFDLCFTIDKETKGMQIQTTIEKTDTKYIKKVELFDIYENEEKLPGQRSITFKVYTQSLEGTLDDKYKNNLIKEIVAKVEKKGGTLR